MLIIQIIKLSKLKTNKLNNLNTKISNLCLGTDNFFSSKLNTKKKIFEILEASISHGYNFFDTAESYSEGRTESILGDFLNKNRNKKIIVATKIGPTINFSPKKLQSSIDNCLKRLRSDVLDICYFHSGSNEKFLNDDFWNIMNRNLGNKIKVLGLSLQSRYLHEKDYTQIQNCKKYNISLVNLLYNPLFPQAHSKFFSMIKKNNLDLITRVPFARGVLFKKEEGISNKEFTEKNIKKAHKRIKDFTKYKKINLNILDWVQEKSNCKSIVLGCSSVSQIKENSILK